MLACPASDRWCGAVRKAVCGGIIVEMVLTTIGEVLEVTVTFGLIIVVMGVAVAIPFAAQFFVDDVREPEE